MAVDEQLSSSSHSSSRVSNPVLDGGRLTELTDSSQSPSASFSHLSFGLSPVIDSTHFYSGSQTPSYSGPTVSYSHPHRQPPHTLTRLYPTRNPPSITHSHPPPTTPSHFGSSLPGPTFSYTPYRLCTHRCRPASYTSCLSDIPPLISTPLPPHRDSPAASGNSCSDSDSDHPPVMTLSRTLMVLGAEVQLLAVEVVDLKGEDVDVVKGVGVVRIAGLQELLLSKGSEKPRCMDPSHLMRPF